MILLKRNRRQAAVLWPAIKTSRRHTWQSNSKLVRNRSARGVCSWWLRSDDWSLHSESPSAYIITLREGGREESLSLSLSMEAGTIIWAAASKEASCYSLKEIGLLHFQIKLFKICFWKVRKFRAPATWDRLHRTHIGYRLQTALCLSLWWSSSRWVVDEKKNKSTPSHKLFSNRWYVKHKKRGREKKSHILKFFHLLLSTTQQPFEDFNLKWNVRKKPKNRRYGDKPLHPVDC